MNMVRLLVYGVADVGFAAPGVAVGVSHGSVPMKTWFIFIVDWRGLISLW